MEIFRHGSTHGTETRKTDSFHRRELSGASATKENAVQRTASLDHPEWKLSSGFSALRATGVLDRLGGIHARLSEFDFRQVFAFAVLAGAIHALSPDGLLVALARFLATLGTGRLEILGYSPGD